MEYLPQDPFMLMSAVNMALRDGEYESLEDLCRNFDRSPEELKATLQAAGFEYIEEIKQFR